MAVANPNAWVLAGPGITQDVATMFRMMICAYPNTVQAMQIDGVNWAHNAATITIPATGEAVYVFSDKMGALAPEVGAALPDFELPNPASMK